MIGTLILLALFTLLFYLQLLGYPLFMATFIKKGKPEMSKDYSYQPFISLIVPTYNEGKSIHKRLQNLLAQQYPSERFEILVVDSGSKDNTLSISREFAKDYPNVRIIEEGKRNGKASAINLGRNSARGDIVVVTDANSLFNENALKEIAPYFKNPNIGAVGGRFVLTNSDNNLVGSSSFYWDIESLMRRGESSFDSACTFHGEINAWRKDIVMADNQALAEDLEMAVQIRRKGYKVAYEPEAIAYEAGPTTNKEQIVQKKRTAIGTIQCFFKHRQYLLWPHDKYSWIIFPLHKVLQIVSPLVLIGVLALCVYCLWTQEYLLLLGYLSGTLAAFGISYLILNRKLAQIRISRLESRSSFSPLKLFRIGYYVLLHELIILFAWRDFISGKYSVKWKKAETTRN